MLSKVIEVCVILLIALSSVSAQVASDTGSGLAGQPAVATVREHGPRKALGLHPDRVIDGVTVAESSNWSGYAVTGAWFTQVKGSWTVPAVDCTALPDSSASFWVGLDGWVTDTVEQTGTDSDCDGETAHYYAWFEFFPNAGVTITSVPISPGDQMSAEVIYNGSEFAVSITNESTGNSYRKSAIVALAQRVSAEWIAEMNGYRLSDFGTVFFGEDHTGVRGTNYAANESTSGQIGAFVDHLWESVLVNGKSVEAVPSSLSADGTSFTVAWKAE